MVKKDIKTSISEEEGDSLLVNDNGKRLADSNTKDGKKRLKTKSLYRQPTANELNRLQETENLFNSNLFRLQVDEILSEVKVKEKTEKRFQQWFTDFKNHLLSIPEDNTEYDLTQQILFKQLKVKIPVTDQLKKTKCMFKFHKFKDVDIVGSYALGCSINSKLIVDVQITVPSETYTKNDSVNYRYHKKRAAYLAYIASHLNNSKLIEDIKYSWLNSCKTRPVIDLKPAGKLANNLSIRIYLVCDNDTYKLHRFSPIRNNLRESWLYSENPENSSEVGPPTPYYNNGVLRDLTANVNQQFLRDILINSTNLKHAIVLLKVWLRQRNLTVSGHVVSLLVAYLVQTKRINNIMSSYQIVRNVWIALKTSEWDTKGISLCKNQDSPPIEEFHQHFPAVFLDTSGYYNICGDMCKGTYNALRRECELAVQMLDNGKINSFMSLFMTPVKPLMQYDHILRFKNLSDVKKSILQTVSKESRVSYGVEQLPLVTDTLYTLLSQALGNRVQLLQQLVDADFSWPVNKTPEKGMKEGCEERLSFGMILDPENALNVIEKGPPANLPEAEQFRAFWGDKSELRRFQDGSITETCVWDGETMAERRLITKQIIDYLLNFKYGIASSELFHVCDQLSRVTGRKHPSEDPLQVEECSMDVLRTFDELRRDLRLLTQLPLDIAAVYGTSSVFSYSSPFPPLPCGGASNPWRRANACLIKDIKRQDGIISIPEYIPVTKAVIELGHSGKWPGDIEAFRCLKAAFHLQIAERINKQYSLPTQAYPTHVDVLKNGLVFRLEIAHPKEITLLRREMENGVVKFRDSDKSVALQCDSVLLPRLRGALHGLHQKYSAFGPTVCLFKRWLSAHLLSPPHFPEIVAELLVAAVFLRPEPSSPPTQPTCGLLRVLRLLVHTDWTKEMLVLDFNEDMTSEELTDIDRMWRESPNSLHIVTAYDGTLPAIWTKDAPSVYSLARARKLATSALVYLEQALLTDMKDNVLGVFVGSLVGYDVIIHLHPSLVPLHHDRLGCGRSSQSISKGEGSCDVIPVVEFHPVLNYLRELRSAYSEFALFFHDLYGGEDIAVLWKPDINELREFQILQANALKPVLIEGEKKYRVNTAALVDDFRALGSGLVKDITVN